MRTRQTAGEHSRPLRPRKLALQRELCAEESGQSVSVRTKRKQTGNGPAPRRSKRVLTNPAQPRVGINRAPARPPPVVDNSSTKSHNDEEACSIPPTVESDDASMKSRVQMFEEGIALRQLSLNDVLPEELSRRETPNERAASLRNRNPHTHNLVEQACKYRPSQEYYDVLTSQTAKAFNEQSRKTVVAWLMYLHRELRYELSPQTVQLSVQLFDRFANSIILDKASRWAHVLSDDKSLQAVSTACYYIASKLQDPKMLYLKDAVDLAPTAKAPIRTDVSVDDVLAWELIILEVLEFKVNSPTALDFLVTYTNSEDKLKVPGTMFGNPLSSYKDCAQYITELALLQPDSVLIPAHILAAAALCCVITYVDNKQRKISNLPNKVLDWLKNETTPLRKAATKMSKLFETRIGRADEEPDITHRRASDYLVKVYSNRHKKAQPRAI
eukprot:Selendium_serpulae@DN6434_c0_g1_i1.p1